MLNKLNNYSGLIAALIALFSVLSTIYFANKTAKLTKQANEINKLELEQTKITDPLILKTVTDKNRKGKVRFTLDDGKIFDAEVSLPIISTENGSISNVYFFVPDKNNDIITRTIENSQMINSSKTRKVILNNKSFRTYRLPDLYVHKNLAFYIILIKGFNNDWTSYIVTYKFYHNHQRCYFGVNQPNILASTDGYKDLSKDDINTVKQFYTKVIDQLRGINFIN